MLVYPPFHFILQGSEFNLGYNFIMKPPKFRGYIKGSVNVKLLMLQYLFACTIGMGIFFLLRNLKEKKASNDLNIRKSESDNNNHYPKEIWLYIAGFLLFGAYAAMFIPAFAGKNIDPNSGYSSMFITCLFFYIWWKRRGRKGWQGALLGTLIGIIVFVLAAYIEGLMRNIV